MSGRAADLARELGGESRSFYSLPGAAGRLAPFRWAVSAVQTLAYLARARPDSVIATAPPIFPGLIALAYRRLYGGRTLLDAHPGAFGLQGDRLSRWLLPVLKRMIAAADATLVTDEVLSARVRAWQGRPAVVHEAPIGWTVERARPIDARARVLVIGTFQRDEPIDAVVEAARLEPSIDFQVTGDPRRCPQRLLRSAPPNLSFVGWLTGAAYPCAIAGANVVLALTTEPSSVLRSGYEAVYAGRPLVVSDWPVLREIFPYAVHVASDGEGIAAGLRAAVDRHAHMIAAVPKARALQHARWKVQLAGLRKCLGVETFGRREGGTPRTRRFGGGRFSTVNAESTGA